MTCAARPTTIIMPADARYVFELEPVKKYTESIITPINIKIEPKNDKSVFMCL